MLKSIDEGQCPGIGNGCVDIHIGGSVLKSKVRRMSVDVHGGGSMWELIKTLMELDECKFQGKGNGCC